MKSSARTVHVFLRQPVRKNLRGYRCSIPAEQGIQLEQQKCAANQIEPQPWQRPVGHDTGIQVYNSLTRCKEPLILPKGKLITWYTCGPTVYDKAHIGHASSYVRTDIIRRVLTSLFNIDVVMMMGVTDIDDKIIKRAQELKVDFKTLARKYESEFFRDMGHLKVIPPTVKTRVTEHIPYIISFIQKLIQKEYAYATSTGTVYFDVMHYGHYGRLWTHSMDTQIREASDKEKHSPRDFALWKGSKDGEPWWDSPWGRGRPGWHIECSTMANYVFGETLDVHSGGDDLRFPHHENEMAQCEACFGGQWTNYWLHTGHLHLKNDQFKMSKSLQNTIWVSDLLNSYTANQFRIFCLLRPYRQSIEYSEESMLKAVRIHSSWAAFLNSAEAYVRGQLICSPIQEAQIMNKLEQCKLRIEAALADDFDTPKAVVALEDLVRTANISLGKKVKHDLPLQPRSPGVIAAVMAYVDRVMDLFGVQILKKKGVPIGAMDDHFDHMMDSAVRFRCQVRNFALNPPVPTATHAEMNEADRLKEEKRRMSPLLAACDEIRNDFKMCGVSIQDHGQTSTWDVSENRAARVTSTSGVGKKEKKEK